MFGREASLCALMIAFANSGRGVRPDVVAIAAGVGSSISGCLVRGAGNTKTRPRVCVRNNPAVNQSKLVYNILIIYPYNHNQNSYIVSDVSQLRAAREDQLHRAGVATGWLYKGMRVGDTCARCTARSGHRRPARVRGLSGSGVHIFSLVLSPVVN